MFKLYIFWFKKKHRFKIFKKTCLALFTTTMWKIKKKCNVISIVYFTKKIQTCRIKFVNILKTMITLRSIFPNNLRFQKKKIV